MLLAQLSVRDKKMKLESIDLEILENAAHDEPWHILCGMLSERFADIKELIPRVFTLREKGLLEINRDPGTDIDPKPEDPPRSPQRVPACMADDP